MAGPLLGVAAHAAVAPPKAPSTHEPPPVPMPAEFPPTQSRGEHAGSTLLPGVKSRDTTQDGDAGAVERQLSQAHQVGKQVSLFPSEQNSPGAAKAAKVGMVLSDLQNKVITQKRNTIMARLKSSGQRSTLLQEESLQTSLAMELVAFWRPRRPLEETPLEILQRAVRQIVHHLRQERDLRRQVLEWTVQREEADQLASEAEIRAQRDRKSGQRECLREVFTGYHAIQRPLSDDRAPARTPAGAARAAVHPRRGIAAAGGANGSQRSAATAARRLSVRRPVSPEQLPFVPAGAPPAAEEAPGGGLECRLPGEAAAAPAEAAADGGASAQRGARSRGRAFMRLRHISEARPADSPKPGSRLAEAPQRCSSAGAVGRRPEAPLRYPSASAAGRLPGAPQRCSSASALLGGTRPDADGSAEATARHFPAGAAGRQVEDGPADPTGAWQAPRDPLSAQRRASQRPGIRAVELGGPSADRSLTSYLRACETTGIAPKPIPFVTGQSLALAAGGRQLVDRDLHAVAAALPCAGALEDIDLEGNTMLTDASLVPFFRRLVGLPAARSCLRLSLRQCHRAGLATLDTIAGALGSPRGLSALLRLDLGGVAIPSRCQASLCRVVKGHKSLRAVCLADVSLGHSATAAQLVEDLLGSATLEELDLGWNCFTSEALSHLGECLVGSRKCLKALLLANCSAATQGDAPVLHFVEKLSSDNSLTSLDVSLNRIDHAGALVLEDALAHHQLLADVDVSHNPLGARGTRCMLRLLFQNNSGLVRFRNEGCDSVSDTFDHTTSRKAFDNAWPDGHYVLDLEVPSQRAVLRMLYKTCRRYSIEPSEGFSSLCTAGLPGRGAAKGSDPTRSWSVPTAGRLEFRFSSHAGRSRALGCEEGAALSTVLQRMGRLNSLPLGQQKETAFLALWKGLTHTGKITLLNALSGDFSLTYPQVVQLCAGKSRAYVVEILRCTLHCIDGGATTRYLALQLPPTLGDFLQARRRVSALLDFNPDNPTGHYMLLLENAPDYQVGQSLLVLSRWEASATRASGKRDVSELGDWAHVRNVHYRGTRVRHSVQSWSLPSTDELRLDYVTGRRLGPDARKLDRTTFENMLSHLQTSRCSVQDQLKVLRRVSDQVCVDAMHLREMLGVLVGDAHGRAELFVMFFFRVVDIRNEKTFRVRFTDQREIADLRRRLGYMVTFPFVQPEMAKFELDFAVHDQRLAINTLVRFAAKEGWEKGKEHLRGPRYDMLGLQDPMPLYVMGDGTVNALALGVPRSWETFEKMPVSGTLSCTYTCGPEQRDLRLRSRDLAAFGGWNLRADEGEEVEWWAAATDFPPDVLAFLEFLVSRFHSVEDAFKTLDVHKVGCLTIQTFEEGLETLKCKKFRGPDQRSRIEKVFRHLDVDNGGRISNREWDVLGDLWKELRTSIREFVHFLERHFADPALESETESSSSGSSDSSEEWSGAPQKKGRSVAFDCGHVLERAWVRLAQDQIGGITEREWIELVRTQLRYFGPSDIIFRFLDSDVGGTISWDEFERLEVFLRGGSAKRRASQLARMQLESDHSPAGRRILPPYRTLRKVVSVRDSVRTAEKKSLMIGRKSTTADPADLGAASAPAANSMARKSLKAIQFIKRADNSPERVGRKPTKAQAVSAEVGTLGAAGAATAPVSGRLASRLSVRPPSRGRASGASSKESVAGALFAAAAAAAGAGDA